MLTTQLHNQPATWRVGVLTDCLSVDGAKGVCDESFFIYKRGKLTKGNINNENNNSTNLPVPLTI